jgi:hypothetical protein
VPRDWQWVPFDEGDDDDGFVRDFGEADELEAMGLPGKASPYLAGVDQKGRVPRGALLCSGLDSGCAMLTCSTRLEIGRVNQAYGIDRATIITQRSRRRVRRLRRRLGGGTRGGAGRQKSPPNGPIAKRVRAIILSMDMCLEVVEDEISIVGGSWL